MRLLIREGSLSTKAIPLSWRHMLSGLLHLA